MPQESKKKRTKLPEGGEAATRKTRCPTNHRSPNQPLPLKLEGQMLRRVKFNRKSATPPVFTEISNLVRGSNIYWRGRAFAASVPSDIPKDQKGRKRVSKDERKAMVESFVNKYRAMNAGKFPTASEARNQVGGSYYSIRKIIQELEYKSKISSINTRKTIVLGKEVAKVNEASTDVEEVSSSRLRMDPGIHTHAQTVAGNDVDIGDSTLKNVGAEEGPKTSTLFEKTLSEEVVKPKMTDDCSSYVEKQSHVLEAEVVFHRRPERAEHGVKERAPSERVLGVDGPKPKHELHQQSPELDEFVMDLSKKQTDDEELPKKSSMWGNLKSLADGIVNMWKRL